MAEWAIEIDLCLFLFVLQVKDKAYRISSNKTLPQIIPEIIITPAGLLRGNRVSIKDFRASGLGQVRHLTAATAATAAITLACLFVEMLCYVLGRLHSSCVHNTRISFQRIEVINKTLVTDDFSKTNLIFDLFMVKFISYEKVSFQSYQNKKL